MELLERDLFLGALEEYAAEAESGNGRLVLVTGEAGIGKTSLVDTFRAGRPDLTWLWGACDGGFTPRPLGPLFDIAATSGGRLRDLVSADADRNTLFSAFVGLLGDAARSWSRTCTGPTRRRWTGSATSPEGSPRCPHSSWSPTATTSRATTGC